MKVNKIDFFEYANKNDLIIAIIIFYNDHPYIKIKKVHYYKNNCNNFFGCIIHYK
jgi:hypothetical protein